MESINNKYFSFLKATIHNMLNGVWLKKCCMQHVATYYLQNTSCHSAFTAFHLTGYGLIEHLIEQKKPAFICWSRVFDWVHGWNPKWRFRWQFWWLIWNNGIVLDLILIFWQHQVHQFHWSATLVTLVSIKITNWNIPSDQWVIQKTLIFINANRYQRVKM